MTFRHQTPARSTHSPALPARGGAPFRRCGTERSDLYALRAQLDGPATPAIRQIRALAVQIFIRRLACSFMLQLAGRPSSKSRPDILKVVRSMNRIG